MTTPATIKPLAPIVWAWGIRNTALNSGDHIVRGLIQTCEEMGSKPGTPAAARRQIPGALYCLYLGQGWAALAR